MLKKNYIYIALLATGMIACSDSEDNHIPGSEGEEVTLSAGYNTEVEVTPTKTTSPEFNKAFDLYQKQTAPSAETVYTLQKMAALTTGENEYKLGIYWDDIGGINAKFDLLGIHPQERDPLNPIFKPDNLTTPQNWAIETNQQENNGAGYDQSDLLISDLITSYIVHDSRKMLFNHALSKITLMIIPGDGFGNAFSPEPIDVKLKGFETIASVSAMSPKGSVVASSSEKKDITPKDDGTKAEATKTAVIKTAIVIPGQSFLKDYNIAQFKIDGNTYQVNLASALLLLQGKNHILKITVNKTGTDMQATIQNWDDKLPAIESSVKIGVDTYTTPQGDRNPVENSLLFMKVNDLSNTYKYNSSIWSPTTADKHIYWDDIKIGAGLKADAILFNFNTINSYTSISNYPDSIYIGQSQELNKHYDVMGFGEMQHPFSKVNIKVQSDYTSTKKDSVTISNITSFSLEGLKKFTKVVTDPIHTDYLKVKFEDDADYTLGLDKDADIKTDDSKYYYYSMSAYVQPGVTIASGDLLLTVTVVTNGITNRYPMTLPAANAPLEFKQNKEYNITLTLSKTDVAGTITIKKWEPGKDIGGEAGIKDK